MFLQQLVLIYECPKGHIIYLLVIKLLWCDWESKHVTIGFFEATYATNQSFANNLTKLFNKYWLRKKNHCLHVKDQGSNLNTTIIASKFIVRCESFNLDESFQCNFFGHVFFKACQYATTNKKNCRILKFVSIKFA